MEDEGDGLPTDVGDKIFEPFVSTKESGTGLGLSICKRIVEDHGGQITAANLPSGWGRVFRTTTGRPARGANMPTLLIVDDEPNVLYSLEKALKSDILQVVTAARAKQAIELVSQIQPDAVLLDVRLPDMSGSGRI